MEGREERWEGGGLGVRWEGGGLGVGWGDNEGRSLPLILTSVLREDLWGSKIPGWVTSGWWTVNMYRFVLLCFVFETNNNIGLAFLLVRGLFVVFVTLCAILLSSLG